ncbi:hypothetical protein FHW79_005919 [Azospirillum sp. OGB3]|nr:hypothetical protein [Azospirillum sp. OGB3]
MAAPDLGWKLPVGSGPAAFRPPTPRVVPTGGHPEHRAHEPDGELVPVVLDETEPHLGASEKMLLCVRAESVSIVSLSFALTFIKYFLDIRQNKEAPNFF